MDNLDDKALITFSSKDEGALTVNIDGASMRWDLLSPVMQTALVRLYVAQASSRSVVQTSPDPYRKKST